ncbi:ABC transporter permease [Roseisalinus antarcticus]|uniref:Putative aliphatic sulfonates transport permease protein SsuC n=1 Tax=Roseisalinus antarcticus TaxID=254357 RepID=A0A1Y5TH75_9RHOB|nr:ABC transporter permease subunit [Roseisalinus antarcticus]SLN61987.1 Putative aliphatic sulfonates transport permease protein SsuC [Roseisalinus antarcticus]
MPHQVAGNAIFNLVSSERLPGIGLPSGGYLPHLLFTARNVLTGGVIGVAVGIAAGLASAERREIGQVLGPIMSLFGTMPIIVLAPFFLIWFGLSGTAQVVQVAIYSAAILYVFTLRGVNNLSPAFSEYAATLGASATTRFLRVRLPGSLPEIFGGLRIAFAGNWGIAAATEMLGGQYGSGRVIVALRSVYDLTGIMAVVALLAVLALLVDGTLLAIRARLLRWASVANLSGAAR